MRHFLFIFLIFKFAWKFFYKEMNNNEKDSFKNLNFDSKDKLKN